MATRREFVAALAGGAAIALLAAPSAASAAAPTVEIIALPHPPVQTALKPVRDFLGGLGSKVAVVELDAESPAGEKRLERARPQRPYPNPARDQRQRPIQAA